MKEIHSLCGGVPLENMAWEAPCATTSDDPISFVLLTTASLYPTSPSSLLTPPLMTLDSGAAMVIELDLLVSNWSMVHTAMNLQMAMQPQSASSWGLLSLVALRLSITFHFPLYSTFFIAAVAFSGFNVL